MKFQPDSADGRNLVTRYDSTHPGPGGPPRLVVGATAHLHSVLLPWQGEVQPWGVDTLAALTEEHFNRILPFKPELVVFGSGRMLRFVPPALLRRLIEARIGVETMDTAAACRTYNVLAGEHRNVLAALLLEPPAA